MTQDNMLDAPDLPDIRYDHTNLKAHWEKLGRPVCELLNEKDNWASIYEPVFYPHTRYRIKDDPNWELRERWLASNRKMQVELWDPEDHVWDLVTGMHRIGDVKYREKITTAQSVENIIAEKRKREFDRKHPDVVPTKKTLVTVCFSVPKEASDYKVVSILEFIRSPAIKGEIVSVEAG